MAKLRHEYKGAFVEVPVRPQWHVAADGSVEVSLHEAGGGLVSTLMLSADEAFDWSVELGAAFGESQAGAAPLSGPGGSLLLGELGLYDVDYPRKAVG